MKRREEGHLRCAAGYFNQTLISGIALEFKDRRTWSNVQPYTVAPAHLYLSY